MKTTTKTLTLAALLLIMGQSAAFSMDADTIDVKTDSVKVQKKTDKKHECCADSTVEDHKDPYHKVVKEGGSVREGLFTVRHIKDDWYLEVPDDLLGRMLLCVTRFTSVPQDFKMFGGEEVNRSAVYLERYNDKTLFLREYVQSSYAKSGDRIAISLKQATVDPIVCKFDIIGRNPETKDMLINVTKWLMSDNKVTSFSANDRTTLGIGGVMADRTFIDSIKTYPINLEIQTLRTYAMNAGHSPASKTGAATLSLNTSIVLLPEEPMQPRYFDDRVGYFNNKITEFSDQQQTTNHQAIVMRYRLEPKDPKAYKAGKLVEPKKQIVYYIDPATPKQWRKYLIQGVNDWNVAFEQAGWKNAIHAEEWPENADSLGMSLEDARFSVIRYLASPIANAYGPHVSDPRSGEIIESHIGWYHNVMQLIHDWYLIQAGAVDSRTHKMQFDEELMGQLIRFVSSHEVGHTLGLRHNMGASSATPVDSLRDKAWVEANGHTASIMDYARFNYVAQPEDHISEVGLFPRINTYDKWAIEWGYKYFPEVTTPILYDDGEYVSEADQERRILNKMTIERLARSRRYWFGGEGYDNDPRAQTEDLGDDQMRANEYGIKNLKRIVGELPYWVREEGDLDLNLSQLYSGVISQMQRYVGHVGRNIGGVYHTYKSVEEFGDVYAPEEKDRVKRAMKWLDEQVLTEPTWIINVSYIRRLTTDPQSVIQPLANQAVSSLCSAGTFNNVVRYSYDSKAYQPADYVNDMVRLIFRETMTGQNLSRWRRYVQSRAVDTLIENWSTGTTSEAHAYVTQALQQIYERVKQAGGDAATRAHYKDLEQKIKLTFEK